MDGIDFAVALGCNVGDRPATLSSAIDALALAGGVEKLKVSSFYDTPFVPSGTSGRTVPEQLEQPPVLNAALVGVTTLTARALLDRLLAIELEFKRTRPYPGAPRTLDLDLILYGDAIIDEPGLQVPHPRFRERAFVLEPLAEIAPDRVDPVTGLSVGELWRLLQGRPG